MNRLVELRIRTAKRPAFRYELGRATTRAELGDLYRQRDLLRRLHSRGEFDVLAALRAGQTTPAELERLVDEWGIADYRKHLKLAPAANGRGVPTLDVHVVSWLETIKKPGTMGVYRKGLTYLREFAIDGARLGDRPWYQIPRHVIRDAQTALRARLAGNTIRTVTGSWSGFFEWAIEREKSQAETEGRQPVLEVNPVRTARVWDPIEITRHRFLSWEEYGRLIEAAPEPMRAQYATLTLAGLRIGELMALPAAHVRLPTHIHVGPWGTWIPKGYPRSKHVVRDVPLHRDLVPLLEQYRDRYAAEADAFFANPNTGRAWTHASFEKRLGKDVVAAGLESGQWSRASGELKRKAEGVTAHTLRHTTASWLAQRDVQMQKIALLLGDTIETITRHYSHLLPTDLDRSINRIGEGE